MESPAAQSVQLISFRGLAAQLIGGCVAGSLLAFGWGILANGTSPQVASAAAIMGCAVWLFASGLAVIALTAITRGELDKLPMAALFTSGARLMLAITLGCLVYFSSTPDAKTFWASFLLAGLVSLVTETAWTIRALSMLNSSVKAPSLTTPSIHAVDGSSASGVR